MSIRNHLHLATDILEPNWMQTKLESMNLVVMETSEFHMTTCYEIFRMNALWRQYFVVTTFRRKKRDTF